MFPTVSRRIEGRLPPLPRPLSRLDRFSKRGRPAATRPGWRRPAQPAWAPNGAQISYTRAWGRIENDQIEHAEIYLMNANGGGARPLTAITTSKPFSADVEAATWSPNGKQLVFGIHNSKRGEPENVRALFVINADGSGQRQLTPWSLNAGGARPDWSPDGKLILFRVAGAKRQHGNIYTIHSDGSGLKQLTHYPEPKMPSEHQPNTAMRPPAPRCPSESAGSAC